MEMQELMLLDTCLEQELEQISHTFQGFRLMHKIAVETTPPLSSSGNGVIYEVIKSQFT